MLEKPNENFMLNKILGSNLKYMDPNYKVPRNSANNITVKPCSMCNAIKAPAADSEQMTYRCEHCENMAKNFLYLESLIRCNYVETTDCQLCQSALQYLKHVNKNITKIYGSFDGVVEAAKAFNSSNIKKPAKKKYSADLITKLQSKRVPDEIKNNTKPTVIRRDVKNIAKRITIKPKQNENIQILKSMSKTAIKRKSKTKRFRLNISKKVDQ